MADEIEIGSKAIKQIQQLRDELLSADQALLKLSQNALQAGKNIGGISTPGGLSKSGNDNAKTLQDLEALKIKYNDLIIKKQQYAKVTAEESVNQRILNRNATEAARINSALAGAYGRLSAEQSKASRTLQDLIARGRTATQTQKEYDKEIRTATQDFNSLNQRVLAADRAVGRFNRNVGNYPMNAARNIRDLVSAFGVVTGVQLFAQVTKDIYETTKQIESLDKALKQVTGTNETFAQSQAFLSRVSEAYGANINGLTKQFTQFYVAAKDKISGREIEQIFESITKAGATMGLSQEQQERAFLALNQMMSKGTIQAEELRGQLGEALPGALGIMAKSLGVTEAELGKMMKDGQLLASDVLPKFAKQLEITYGIEQVERVETLAAAQGRLANSWIGFVRTLQGSDGALSKALSRTLNVLSGVISGAAGLLQSEEEKRQDVLQTLRDEGYRKTISYYESLDVINKTDLKNTRQYNSQKLKEQTEEFNRLKGRNLILKALQRDTPLGSVETTANKNERLANQQRMKEINNFITLLAGENKAIDELMNKTVKSTKVEKEATKQKRDKVEALNLEGVSIGTTIEQMDKYIDMLETELILNAGNETAYKNIKTALEQVKQAKTDLMTGGGEIISTANIKEVSTAVEEVKAQLSDLQKNYLKSFVDEFASNSGFSETFAILNDEVEGFGENFAITFNAIAESAQEAFNFISGASQQRFDEENERLQNQYDLALSYVGDNTSAQEKLAKDLEKRKKEIANREAKAKQKQAIFNIAIDTAQAIMGLWAKPGFPAAIPLAVAVGALGALQIGLVASQKIPQYYMGGTHDGGLMMVNDGGGSNYKETIVTPDGKIMQPTGRNVIMNAPAGTEIFTQDQWNNTLQEMLQGKGISMSASMSSGNGLNAQQIDAIMGKHFSKIALNNVSFDENGMRNWSEKNGNKTISTANRVSRRGINV